jgi:hypothetical protein
MKQNAGVRKILSACSFFVCILACSSSFVHGEEILVDDYQNGLSPHWQEKRFKGKTHYTVVREDGFQCIRAVSRTSASALIYKIEYDLRDYPWLAWTWKVADILVKGDATTRAGDDYAARVYVVFPSVAFWRTKTLVYIWANKLPQGKAVPNPFTANAVMVAVESGREKRGQWLLEKRNVLDDYRQYFGEDPPKAGAVAIMTDTDNTGEDATAWYGPIRILSEKPL